MKKLLLLLACFAPLLHGQSTVQQNVDGVAHSVQVGVQQLGAIPTPPAGAEVYTEIQQKAGWTTCVTCAGGGAGTSTITQNTSFPGGSSGTAMEVSTTSTMAISSIAVNAGGTGYVVDDVITVTESGGSSGQATVNAVSSGVVTGLTLSTSSPGTGYSTASALPTTGGTGTGLTVDIKVTPANALFYNKSIGCPTSVPGGCAATGVIHLLEEGDVYFPSSSGFVAIENDPDLYDGSYEYFDSRQCDSVSGMWRLWNMSANTWITTGYPCMTTFFNQAGVKHHFREYTTISRITKLSTYKSFELDGVTVWNDLGDSFPPQALSGTAALLVEVQEDLNGSAGTTAQTYYVDNLKLTVW